MYKRYKNVTEHTPLTQIANKQRLLVSQPEASLSHSTDDAVLLPLGQGGIIMPGKNDARLRDLACVCIGCVTVHMLARVYSGLERGRAKLRDCAVWPVRPGCYSRAALSFPHSEPPLLL